MARVIVARKDTVSGVRLHAVVTGCS